MNTAAAAAASAAAAAGEAAFAFGVSVRFVVVGSPVPIDRLARVALGEAIPRPGYQTLDCSVTGFAEPLRSAVVALAAVETVAA